MDIKNAVIESTTLGIEDHGVFTAMIHLDYGDCGHQGFGGYCLGMPPDSDKPSGPAASHFIQRVLQIAGVASWEKLPGCSIRVKAKHTSIEAIGHFLKDDWFNPKEELQK